MNLQCIIESAIQDNPDSEAMLNAFQTAASESNTQLNDFFSLENSFLVPELYVKLNIVY